MKLALGILLTAMIAMLSVAQASTYNALTLWYREPAQQWTQALPLGDGKLGAMVFGGVEKERVQFNKRGVVPGEKKSRGAVFRPWEDVFTKSAPTVFTDYRCDLDLGD